MRPPIARRRRAPRPTRARDAHRRRRRADRRRARRATSSAAAAAARIDRRFDAVERGAIERGRRFGVAPSAAPSSAAPSSAGSARRSIVCGSPPARHTRTILPGDASGSPPSACTHSAVAAERRQRRRRRRQIGRMKDADGARARGQRIEQLHQRLRDRAHAEQRPQRDQPIERRRSSVGRSSTATRTLASDAVARAASSGRATSRPSAASASTSPWRAVGSSRCSRKSTGTPSAASRARRRRQERRAPLVSVAVAVDVERAVGRARAADVDARLERVDEAGELVGRFALHAQRQQERAHLLGARLAVARRGPSPRAPRRARDRARALRPSRRP